MRFTCAFLLVSIAVSCDAQLGLLDKLISENRDDVIRVLIPVPQDRRPVITDVIIRHYKSSVTDVESYKIGDILRILRDPDFNLENRTVVYCHGYLELSSDVSVLTAMRAYVQNGDYNILFVDWSNLAFGGYLKTAVMARSVGVAVATAIRKLLVRKLSLEGLHFVGNSLGAHVMGVAGRTLIETGYTVPRISGLDPSHPGFYSTPLRPLFEPISSADADFVDIIHTDAGGYGAPNRTGHANFWPNGGTAKQPGCPSVAKRYSDGDFCSHWRAWRLWAESVTGGEFLARECSDYDTFLRGGCSNETTVTMGLNSRNGTEVYRGNFYLKTAGDEPFALGESGAT